MKILAWNLENFFLTKNTKTAYNQSLKPQKQIHHIIEILNQQNADICFFCEVGGLDSALLLQNQLATKYDVHYTEGHSDRGIGLSFFIKHKSFKHRFVTHEDFYLPPITLEDKKNPRNFSRDIAELQILDDKSIPSAIFWGVHLKSAQDRSGADFRGFRQRSAEVRGLVQLMTMRKDDFPHCAQIVLGDFNGILQPQRRDAEFDHLFVKRPELIDVLEHLDWPTDKRETYTSADKTLSIQLDYILYPSHFPKPDLNSSGIIHFPIEMAGDRPSDHKPLVATWAPDNSPIISSR